VLDALANTTAEPPLLRWLGARAGWLVPVVIGLHALCWTLLPTLTNASLPLDTVEALLWGREWQLGYDKHPPLSAWVAELAATVGGGRDIALYALSQACVAIGAWAMWRLARDVVDEGRAAFSALALLVGVHYMHFTSPEFNVNVLQIPLWGLLFLLFWRAVSRNGAASMLAWVGVGVCFGLAMLTKYLAAFALPPLALFAVLTPTGRRALRTPGPYIAGVFACAIFLPHFLWMLDTDFVTLRYGMRRASGGEREWLDHLRNPAKFIGAQVMASAAALVVMFFSGAWLHRREGGDRANVPSRDARVYIWLIAIGPVLAMAAYSLVTGARLRSMWGTSMVLAVPVLLTMLARFDAKPSRVRGLVIAWIGLFVLALGAYFVDNAAWPRFTNDAKRTNYPGRELAITVESAWRERVPDQPLLAVIGDEFYAGLVSWYGSERPLVYIDGTTERTFWIDDEGVRATGAMVVWKIGMADRPGEVDRSFFDDLRTRFPNLVELDPITLTPELRGPFGGPIDGASEILGLAIIPPADAPAQ
jgi:4-amino-4-deoxy-L-arabinose transferase-like glycosyltransferase